MSISIPPQLVAVTEEERPGSVPALLHPQWRSAYPWLVQGVTTRGTDDEPFDLGLFTGAPGVDVLRRWELLRKEMPAGVVVHARQVHEATVRLHSIGTPALRLVDPCDGHVTRDPGVTLAVATADCVPVTLIAPERRVVAVLHAGWRGTVAGIVESGLGALQQRLQVPAGALHAHLGPAICGTCYEVGPEVHEALGLARPAMATPVDLRRVVAARLIDAGVGPARLSCSTWCTRCGDSPFYSHRAGDRHRQVTFVGVRA